MYGAYVSIIDNYFNVLSFNKTITNYNYYIVLLNK